MNTHLDYARDVQEDLEDLLALYMYRPDFRWLSIVFGCP